MATIRTRLLHPSAARQPAGPGWPVLMLLAVAAALAIGWVGYTASDDAAYHQAASLWIAHPPQAGADHWATRFPLILTLAAAIRALGDGPAAMSATALGWYAVFLLLTVDLARRIAGPRAGWIAGALMATLPVVIAQATTVSCDLTEASFLLLGVRLAGDVAAGGGGEQRAFAAGLAFGGAVLCRETTALALFGFVPLFLAGRPLPRRALLLVAAGCLLLLGAEACYQYALTGDPLHRWTLAFHHDSHIDRAANLEGNFLLDPWIDPLLVLLVNDDFALLFWLAIAAAVLRVDRAVPREGRPRMLVLMSLAAATFLLVGALYTKLVLNPRYFMLPALAAAIAVAAWLDRLATRPRALLLAAALGANFLMLSVENQHPRWPAQALTAAAAAHPGETVHANAETVHRAEQTLAWDHLRATADVPQPGDLVLSPADAIPAGVTAQARYPSPPTHLGAVLTMAGVNDHLPAGVRHRLLSPNPTLAVWRRP